MAFELRERSFEHVRHLRPRAPGRDPVRRSDVGDFGIGIEEEYFLVDADTMAIVPETPDCVFREARAAGPAQIGREFLQTQIEVATRPHSRTAATREELIELRQCVAQAARKEGLALLACGTHPTGRWRQAVQSPGERYCAVMDGLQMIGQRNLLCGMHVHVQLPDPDRRVEVMTRLVPYIPLLLALSTSSPFWQSRDTGLKGYRLAAYDELPRTGLPELFWTSDEYDDYVQALVRSGAMKDSSYVWWAVRPSHKYPTLELRAPDCCTRIDDAVAIAALYRTLARYLFRNPDVNRDMDVVDRGIAVENKWRAQRYGVQGTFVTLDGAVSVREMLDGVIEDTAADADALGCEAAVQHCRTIVQNGTSADVQLRLFHSAEDQDEARAFRQVAAWIAAASVQPGQT